jgi:hypothetical protein
MSVHSHGTKRVSAARALRALTALTLIAAPLAACGASGTPSPVVTVTVTKPATPPVTNTPTVGPSSATPSPTPTPTSPPPFESSVSSVDSTTRAAMLASGSWKPGCPVRVEDLRVLTLTYWGFDGRAHIGRLMVTHDGAGDVVAAMHALYDSRFPIRRMELVDKYGGDDERSMAADNTSAYNGRKVPGSTVWSQHAYGRAIDIDPLENPMIQGGVVDPAAAARYADRSLKAMGMIKADDVIVRAFAAVGWQWGGYWHSLKDYQHFSQNGY